MSGDDCNTGAAAGCAFACALLTLGVALAWVAPWLWAALLTLD